MKIATGEDIMLLGAIIDKEVPLNPLIQ